MKSSSFIMNHVRRINWCPDLILTKNDWWLAFWKHIETLKLGCVWWAKFIVQCSPVAEIWRLLFIFIEVLSSLLININVRHSIGNLSPFLSVLFAYIPLNSKFLSSYSTNDSIIFLPFRNVKSWWLWWRYSCLCSSPASSSCYVRRCLLRTTQMPRSMRAMLSTHYPTYSSKAYNWHMYPVTPVWCVR